jgi:hypothetical protein
VKKQKVQVLDAVAQADRLEKEAFQHRKALTKLGIFDHICAVVSFVRQAHVPNAPHEPRGESRP